MTPTPEPSAAVTTDELRDALQPFADVAEYDIGENERDGDFFEPMRRHNRAPRITVGDLRRAQRALATSTTPPPAGDVEALQALSERADAGAWSIYQRGHDEGPFQRDCTIQVEKPGCTRAIANLHFETREQGSANAAFIVALVNAYRSGELVRRTQVLPAQTTTAAAPVQHPDFDWSTVSEAVRDAVSNGEGEIHQGYLKLAFERQGLVVLDKDASASAAAPGSEGGDKALTFSTLVEPDLPSEIAAGVMALYWATHRTSVDEACDRHGEIQNIVSAALARRSAPATGQGGGLDELGRGELLRRAKGMVLAKGWTPGDRIHMHAVGQLMRDFGQEVLKKPPTERCNYPDCGCDADAACNEAFATPAARPATGGATRLDREAVARIIHPEAFKLGNENYFGPDMTEGWYSAAQRVAYKKTDTILAFDPAPQSQAASGEVREARQRFLRAYRTACESSGFDDWMNAALLAKQYDLFLDHDAAITPAGRGADASGWRDEAVKVIEAVAAEWPADGQAYAKTLVAIIQSAAPTAQGGE